MACSGRYNICLKQGATYNCTFILRHKITITEAAASSATTLKITSLQHNLNNGSTLTFGTVTVTLTSAATAGDRTLTVSAISAAIAKNTSALGNLYDLTGKSARSNIREMYSSTTALGSFTCTIVSPATNGEIRVSMTAATTAGITANIAPNKADDIVDLQANTFPTKEETKLFLAGKQPYVWDLEIYSGDPEVVDKPLYGQVLVTAEATKV